MDFRLTDKDRGTEMLPPESNQPRHQLGAISYWIGIVQALFVASVIGALCLVAKPTYTSTPPYERSRYGWPFFAVTLQNGEVHEVHWARLFVNVAVLAAATAGSITRPVLKLPRVSLKFSLFMTCLA